MSDKKTFQELSDELKLAAEKVEAGGLYYHYKNPQRPYKVVGLAIMEADNNVCVIYSSPENKEIKFVRPLSSWLDVIDLEGKSVPRFKKLV